MSENPPTNNSEKHPVVLGHAACTGGSLIYRILVATFGFEGLSEVGVARVPSLSKYNPWDPECQLFAQNKIPADKFAAIIFDRIVSCQQFTDARLLVREHTHSFYFNAVDSNVIPNGGSWFSDHYRKRFSVDVPCLVSVRDPVDSWLGFRRSFPQQEPVDFDIYCQRYCDYLDKIDAENETTGQFHLFKYEDLLLNAQAEIDKIADHVGEARKTIDLSYVGKLFGSGNSGRVSSNLQQRNRRPFSRRFLRATERSQNYAALCSRLGYPQLADNLTAWDSCKSHFYSVLSGFSSLFQVVESPARWFKETLKTGKNIQ